MGMGCRIRGCNARATRYMAPHIRMIPVSRNPIVDLTDLNESRAHAYCKPHFDYIKRRFGA